MNILQAQNRDQTMYYPKKKPFHWRTDSGELDVFEAAGYFKEPYMKLVREQQQQQQREQDRNYHSTRRSLDTPCIRRSNPLIHAPDYQNLNIIDQKQLKYDDDGEIENKKKWKQQPSSPGGRLASFLNSLFSQTSLKKKNKEREESPAGGGGIMRRRSSISHFRITKAAAAAAAASDLPPPLITPTKSYKEPTLAEHHAHAAPCRKIHHKLTDTDDHRTHINSGKTRLMLINDDDDDDGESDSSSDLFDLPNHDLDLFGSTSSSLPVYQTSYTYGSETNITCNYY